METFLIYADHHYYKLVYFAPHKAPPKPFELTKIEDDSDRLHNILPKYIHSHGETHYIVDIENTIHCVLFNKKEVILCFDLGNTITDNNKLVTGMNTTNYIMDKYFRKCDMFESMTSYMLLKSVGLDGQTLYEFLEFDIRPDKMALDNQCLLDPSQVSTALDQFDEPYYLCKIDDKTTVEINCVQMCPLKLYNATGDVLPHKEVALKSLPTVNYNIIRNKDMPIQNYDGLACKYVINATSPDGNCVHQPRYTLLVDTDDNCHLYCPKTNERSVIFRLTPDSVILYDDANYDNMMIVTNSHIMIILRSCKIIEFDLPVDYVYKIANTTVKPLTWAKNMHVKLPQYYKNPIKTFVMINRLMGICKIPPPVLSLIFDIVIN